MFEMMRTLRNNAASRATRRLPGNSRGFSLVEMLVMLAIGTILTVMAIPSINAGLRNYRIDGAVSAVTWAIHSTRYQALMQGYPFQVAFSSAANNYQIQSSPTSNGVFGNVGTTVPISSWPITLSADTTLNFKPNGFVSSTPPVTGLTFTMTYQGVCQRLTVTNYGNVSVSPPYPQPTCP
jgi:prepilin-type N-terminal cleavage/methylation domain-containing protein